MPGDDDCDRRWQSASPWCRAAADWVEYAASPGNGAGSVAARAIEIRLLESEPIIDAAALSIVDLGEPVTEADALTHLLAHCDIRPELGQPNAFLCTTSLAKSLPSPCYGSQTQNRHAANRRHSNKLARVCVQMGIWPTNRRNNRQ